MGETRSMKRTFFAALSVPAVLICGLGLEVWARQPACACGGEALAQDEAKAKTEQKPEQKPDKQDKPADKQTKPAPQTIRPGKDRWSVKTATDPDARKVEAKPVKTTIEEMLKLPRPKD